MSQETVYSLIPLRVLGVMVFFYIKHATTRKGLKRLPYYLKENLFSNSLCKYLNIERYFKCYISSGKKKLLLSADLI